MGAGQDADSLVANNLSFDKLFLDRKQLNDIRFATKFSLTPKKGG